jgi:hypothetical protein
MVMYGAIGSLDAEMKFEEEFAPNLLLAWISLLLQIFEMTSHPCFQNSLSNWGNRNRDHAL